MHEEVNLYDVMLANARAGKPAYVFVGEQRGAAARVLVDAINRVTKDFGGEVSVIFKAAPDLDGAAPEAPTIGGGFSGAADLFVGAWVVQTQDTRERPTIGRVWHAYDKDGVPVLDIVLYAHDGRRVGGATPESSGAARPFEPGCRAELWEPIEEPDFDYLGGMSAWGALLKRLRRVPQVA